ncbi:MAG: DNA translocase FtsK [Lachnospiraceae bacterium]|nr:DNA translocase FtsK [Lachnospiraceae bacterium]MDE6251628.1 DNA translocase FtsK [Lachnospiraceae bacterium]
MASAQKGRTSSARTVKGSSTKTKTKPAKSSASKKKLEEPIAAKRRLSPEEAALHMEIKLWISLAVAVLLELSNFGVIGKFGDVVSSFMFGMFGLFAYIIPVLLFLGFNFIMVNMNNPKAITKVITAVLLVLLFCAAFQLIMTGSSMEEFYKLCSEQRNGGGLIGGLIGTGLAVIVGLYGAYIVIFFLIIICTILITEKSFVGGIKKGYTATKSNIVKIKEESAVYNEAKEKNKRYNKKYTGVTDVKLNNPDKPDENLHEIHNIYRGPVSTYDIDPETAEVVEEHKRIVEHEIYETVEKHDTVENNQTHMEEPVKHEEKNEPFKPKEKIEVSKAAKEVMGRKAFSTANIPQPKPSDENEQKAPDVSKGITTPGEPGKVVEQKKGTKKIFRYEFPPLSLLKKGNIKRKNPAIKGLSETAFKLQEILKNFGVNVTVTNESRGPSVTRYELQPEMGTKVSKITSLTDDIKLNLAAADIRIEAPIPGKAAVGIEVPNDTRDPVFLRDLIESDELKNHPSKLAFAAGMDIAGNVIVADIAKMPHMLIAGTTGSGKSVFTNSIIMSILYRADPMEVKVIIVDPKVVEFGVYNGIPHLLTPVVTDPRKAAGALAWAVNEMSDRYKKFAEYNVRDLKGYNEKISSEEPKEGEPPLQKLPQILIIIDELADLMMVAAKEVESSICRLAQLARAAGIHLVIATQRPSVDVVTGLIKANIPSRVALLVSSGIDSRTIIDINGAEKLLGNGDMLFYPSGYVKPVRVQGAFVSDGEVQSVVEFITSHTEKVEYNEEITNQPISSESSDAAEEDSGNSRDSYFAEAGKFVIEKGKGSTSMLQRMYRIGFNRAARIMDQLAQAGVVGEEEGTKPRKVLMTLEEFEDFLKSETNG